MEYLNIRTPFSTTLGMKQNGDTVVIVTAPDSCRHRYCLSHDHDDVNCIMFSFSTVLSSLYVFILMIQWLASSHIKYVKINNTKHSKINIKINISLFEHRVPPHICMVQNLMFPLKLANLGVLSDIFRDINHQIVGRLYPTIITYIYIYYIILLSIIPHYVVLFLASHGCWWNPPPMFGYVWIIAINSWGTRAEAAERHHGPGLRWKCSHNMCLWTLFTIYFTYLYRLYLCIFHLMHCIIFFR